MNKLLVICGPTATGKTELAVRIANKFDGELISADSRQVFREMDIGTGKDLSSKETIDKLRLTIPFGKKSYSLVPYQFHGVPLWLVDVVNPNEEFSVSHFHRLATRLIADISKFNKPPIVVGGTGLYIKSLIDPPDTISIPPNVDLRKQLQEYTVWALQERLQKEDAQKWNKMNESDRKNSRRLVRAIEVADWKKSHKNLNEEVQEKSRYRVLLIGLTATNEVFRKRIEERVEARVKQGILQEIKQLLKKGNSWKSPAMSGMGYIEWKPYFELQLNKNTLQIKKDCIALWKLHEVQYAKRQMTWFRKMQGIQWFDISEVDWQKKAMQKVEEWYNMTHAHTI